MNSARKTTRTANPVNAFLSVHTRREDGVGPRGDCRYRGRAICIRTRCPGAQSQAPAPSPSPGAYGPRFVAASLINYYTGPVRRTPLRWESPSSRGVAGAPLTGGQFIAWGDYYRIPSNSYIPGTNIITVPCIVLYLIPQSTPPVSDRATLIFAPPHRSDPPKLCL